jgi:hypothetical protein
MQLCTAVASTAIDTLGGFIVASSITSPDLLQTIQQAQAAASSGQTKIVAVDGNQVTIPVPFPSPGDWRD